MLNTLVGYARCSTDTQDLTAQRQRLRELGVGAQRIYLDHGLTAASCARPGLDQALAAVRSGDTLVVTFAEFEIDLMRLKAREGTVVARAKGSCAAGHPSSRQAASPTVPDTRQRQLLHHRPRG